VETKRTGLDTMALKRSVAFIIVIVCALGAAACGQSVFISETDASKPGLSYFLPKTLVRVKIAPVGYERGTIVAELSEEEQQAVADAANIRVRAPINRRWYSVLVDKNGGLSDDLITGLEIRIDDENLSSLQIADTNANQILQYDPSILSRDKICVGANNKSLLQFVQASVRDETGQIAISVAKLIGRAIGPEGFAAVSTQADAFIGRTITIEIDPLNTNDWEAVNVAISRYFPQFRRRYKFEAEDHQKLLPSRHTDSQCPFNTICYRTLVPLRLTLLDKRTKQRSVVYAKVANRAITNKVDVTRAFLVDKVTLLGFNDGVLQTVKIHKPSEGLELAKLPLTLYDTILTSALAAPGKFLDEIKPGMDTKTFQDLVTAHKSNVEAIATMQANLRTLREGDLNPESQLQAFSLNCVPGT